MSAPEDKPKIFSTRLPPKLIKQLKAKALQDDTTVQALTERALREILK